MSEKSGKIRIKNEEGEYDYFFVDKIKNIAGDTDQELLYVGDENENGNSFKLKYLGSGEGNDKDLVINAGNQGGEPIDCMRMHQNGDTEFCRTVSANDCRFNNSLAYFNCKTQNLIGTLCVKLRSIHILSMNKYKISVYEYYGKNVATYFIGGYNTRTTWSHYGYNFQGKIDNGVRLGTDGTNYVILIGTTTTEWNFPQVWLEQILTGYNYQTSWSNSADYSITFITDESNLVNIVTCLKNVQAIDISGNAATADDYTESGGIAQALENKAPTNHTHDYNTLTNLPDISNILQQFSRATVHAASAGNYKLVKLNTDPSYNASSILKINTYVGNEDFSCTLSFDKNYVQLDYCSMDNANPFVQSISVMNFQTSIGNERYLVALFPYRLSDIDLELTTFVIEGNIPNSSIDFSSITSGQIFSPSSNIINPHNKCIIAGEFKNINGIKVSYEGHTHSDYLSNITKPMVEAVLTGDITSHQHQQNESFIEESSDNFITSITNDYNVPLYTNITLYNVNTSSSISLNSIRQVVNRAFFRFRTSTQSSRVFMFTNDNDKRVKKYIDSNITLANGNPMFSSEYSYEMEWYETTENLIIKIFRLI